MSLSSKARKERTDSYTSQRSDNTMGNPPELNQLHDRDLSAELQSKRLDTNDYTPQDIMPVDGEPNETANSSHTSDPVEVSDINAARDEDADLYTDKLMDDDASRRSTTYPPADDKVPGADWNRDSEDREVRELGHS
ncbi:hypothetical protein [Larkinella soli]|uniref:hypothetical protein n=1 Tax=Larkinella soli TaxID=1770527 RepID=UPI000FFB2BDF|nr:hypothetical protein [Larkinella soli]